MESRIAQEIKLRYRPVAVLFTNDKPTGAAQFKPGARGCVASMLSGAAKGQTAVFDRQTFGCPGGGVGLCFGNTYVTFPGGIEYFLSTGREGFREGEGYRKTPELARANIEALPKIDIPFAYVIFQPLDQVSPEETPQIVVFYVTPDQLSALVVLANYGRPSSDNVTIPAAAGCQQMVLLPYLESQRELPRAVVGMTDISARPHIDADLLSFAMPWRLYQEMEGNVPGSFFGRAAWSKVVPRLGDAQ